MQWTMLSPAEVDQLVARVRAARVARGEWQEVIERALQAQPGAGVQVVIWPDISDADAQSDRHRRRLQAKLAALRRTVAMRQLPLEVLPLPNRRGVLIIRKGGE